MEPDRPIRVLIADDHPPTRLGVRLSLEAAGFEVCAEESDAKGAIQSARRLKPDICLLDIHMPGGGIAAVEKISSLVPDAAIVMLTVSRDAEHLFSALRAGASGYLLKDIDPDRLPHALRGVLAGEASLPRTLAARLIEEFRDRGRRRVALDQGGRVELTSREWEVLQLLREGLTTAQMADRMYVAPVTVRTHVSAILRKLRVRDRSEAVALLDETGDTP